MQFGQAAHQHLQFGNIMMSFKCLLFSGLILFSTTTMSRAAWSLLFHVDLVPPNWLIPAPVPSEEWNRNRRQVVAPDWLRGPVLPANRQSGVVRVTPQNLQETAAIRASIQRAINEGTYVVATDPQQFQIALSQLGYGNQWPLLGVPVNPSFRLANFWPRLGQRRQLQTKANQ